MSPQSVKPTGPKRTGTKVMAVNAETLNLLLNFRLPPRQSQPLQSLPRRSRKTGSNQGVWNKERFVNAQYRFVMSPTASDYTVHFADPDIFFQWEEILQVIIPRSSALASAGSSEHTANDEGHTSCPICLATPTAPRMTKCGHVFCFPCILHYLSASENKWARCPICFDSVTQRQLKSVKWFDPPTHVDEEEPHAGTSSSSSSSFVDSTPRAGSTMRMRLMQRPSITTLALPRSSTWPSDLLPPHKAPFHFLPDVFEYAKFMLATPSYLINDLTRDLDELASEKRLLESMQDVLGPIYIEAAETKVRNQIAKAAALENSDLKDAVDKAIRDQQEIEHRVAYHAQRKKEEQEARIHVTDIPEAFLATRTSSTPPTPTNTNTNVNRNRQRRNVNPPPPTTSTYYYYQAESGLPIFLHPLDIRILFAHFETYPSLPDAITVRIDSLAEGTINDDLRKRCKYLAHMPEGADVVFIEADLEQVVGSDGLKAFEGPLKMRRSRKKDKERKDDRARTRAEEREREREREAVNASWSYNGGRSTVPTAFEETRLSQEDEVLAAAPQQPQLSGAWGARSFASAAHSAPLQATPAQRAAARREEEEDWDVDGAWHELEQQNSGSRKKRANKLVVLGGGGGRRR